NLFCFNGLGDNRPDFERVNNRKENAPVSARNREIEPGRLGVRNASISPLDGASARHLSRKIKKTEHGLDSPGLSRASDGCGPRRGTRRAVDGRSGGSPPMTLERRSARVHPSRKIQKTAQAIDSHAIYRASDGCGPHGFEFSGGKKKAIEVTALKHAAARPSVQPLGASARRSQDHRSRRDEVIGDEPANARCDPDFAEETLWQGEEGAELPVQSALRQGLRGIRRAVAADGRSGGENARLRLARAVRRRGRRAP